MAANRKQEMMRLLRDVPELVTDGALLALLIDWKRIPEALFFLRRLEETQPPITRDMIVNRPGRKSFALHSAVEYGMFELVCELVRLGSDYTMRNSKGLTPLDLACSKQRDWIVGFLIAEWYNKPWTFKLHSFTPWAFQREVWVCLHSDRIRRLCRDVKFLVFNALLTLHKREYNFKRGVNISSEC